MGSATVFWAIGDFMHEVAFLPFENETFKWFINYGLLVFGFFGMLYWLRWQKKFNEQAHYDPNRIK